MTVSVATLIAIFLGLPIVSLCLMAYSVRWVLAPLISAADKNRLPGQFTVADLLALFVLVQSWMAIIHGLVPRQHVGIWILDAYGWFATGSLWWLGTRTLSRAAIRNPWYRIGFLIFVLPVLLAGALAIPFLPITIIAVLTDPLQPEEAIHNLLILSGISVTLLLLLFGAGLLTRRMVARTVLPPDDVDPNCRDHFTP